MVTLSEVLADLRAESAALDDLVSGLSDVDWSRPTPAVGWTVAHQISHLAWTDQAATLAATSSVEFIRLLNNVLEEPDGFVDRSAAAGIAPPPELLARWRAGREALVGALQSALPGEQLPWFGTAMSPMSSATGRLMETWAHGQDIADTFAGDGGELGAAAQRLRQPTPRLRHVAYLGYRTIGHGFAAHGLRAPMTQFRVELSTPDGALWTYGPSDATERITGPALDFCLLVAQRRHPADLALQTTGDLARQWLSVAQAFAGPPGAGREPTASREQTAGHRP
jgi:uncharacterized protein (TIGR03084 family)